MSRMVAVGERLTQAAAGLTHLMLVHLKTREHQSQPHLVHLPSIQQPHQQTKLILPHLILSSALSLNTPCLIVAGACLAGSCWSPSSENFKRSIPAALLFRRELYLFQLAYLPRGLCRSDTRLGWGRAGGRHDFRDQHSICAVVASCLCC